MTNNNNNKKNIRDSNKKKPSSLATNNNTNKKSVAFSTSTSSSSRAKTSNQINNNNSERDDFRHPPAPDAVPLGDTPPNINNDDTNNNLDDDEYSNNSAYSANNDDNHSTDNHDEYDHYNDDNNNETGSSVVSDSLQEDGDSSSRDEGIASSTISGSSGGSGTSASKSLRSTLPSICGLHQLTMPQLMILVFLIPVILLLTFSSITLTEAALSDAFLEEHKEVFEDLRDAGAIAFRESMNSSEVLVLNENHPNYTRYYDGMMTSRQIFDQLILEIRTQMRDSSLDQRTSFMDDLDEIVSDMRAQRETINFRVAAGRAYRKRLVRIQNRLSRLLLYFGADGRGELLRSRISNYAIVRRLSTYVSNMLASASNIVSRGAQGTGFYDDESAATLDAFFDSAETDIEFLIDASDANIARLVRSFRRSDEWEVWSRTVELCTSGNISNFAHLNEAEIVQRSRQMNAFIFDIDALVLDSIMDGRLLQTAMNEDIIEMVVSVAVCAVSLIIVVYYNNKEKARMDRALDSTAVLAAAVQRFVPKNQLKTMGVRSITQVTPGMSTEVAQTITFTDIRGFTRLSESMSRLELFDWLQNYVARMTKVVSEEKSYIMAFLGDGLGICSPQPTNAVYAAVKMHQSVEEMNLDIVARGSKILVHIGVGINAGVVVAGVFGDGNRLTCTMIAPDVNFASRLEALTKSFGVKILASESTIDQISPDLFSQRRVGKVQVSGSQKPVSVYDIYQIDELKSKEFKDVTKDDFERAVSLIDSDPPLSDKLFEQISLQAKMAGVHDGAAEMYMRRRRGINTSANNSISNGPASPHSRCSSVLSFEKDGELKQEFSSCNQLGGDKNNNNSYLDSNGLGSNLVLPSAGANDSNPSTRLTCAFNKNDTNSNLINSSDNNTSSSINSINNSNNNRRQMRPSSKSPVIMKKNGAAATAFPIARRSTRAENRFAFSSPDEKGNTKNHYNPLDDSEDLPVMDMSRNTHKNQNSVDDDDDRTHNKNIRTEKYRVVNDNKRHESQNSDSPSTPKNTSALTAPSASLPHSATQ